MPAKNTEKQYVSDGYYHIYNRGVEKRIIFQDAQDYAVFLSYVKEYLEPKDEKALRRRLADPKVSSEEKSKILKTLHLNNFSGSVQLLAYCLMPNHFHLLIKQKEETVISQFMNSLCTRYTMYFNRKYKRVGGLYQDIYKAVLVESDEQLLYLSRYIHRNPLALQGQPLQMLLQQPSSYPDYLGKRKTAWVFSNEILSFFSRKNPRLSYDTFVTGVEDSAIISRIILDDQDA